MGNSSTILQNKHLYSVLKQLKWQKQYWLGQSQLVRDLQTNLKGECYHIPINNFQQQIPIYQFRKDNPQYIVTIHSIQQSNQQILCTGTQSAKVVTQRIPFRFNDLGNIGYVQGLYVLQCIFKGAKIINNRYLATLKSNQNCPYIHYTDQMVCFTEGGECKIWVNQNLALNVPYIRQGNNIRSEMVLQTFNIQKNIVRQLFDLIQSRMSGNKFTNYLQNKKQQQQQLIDFQTSLDFINRMRSKQQGQNKRIKNIILPSMVMRGIRDNQNQYNNSGNKSNVNVNDKQINNKQQCQIYDSSITNRLKDKNNTVDNSRMESSLTSTNSVNNLDINRFAVPPRPRKSSKSGSKQKRPSSKTHVTQTTNKPNISQANNPATITPTHNYNHTQQNQYQKISLSTYNHTHNPHPHHIPQNNTNTNQFHHHVHPSSFNPTNNVISPQNNPRSHPVLHKKQSNQSTKPRSPFKQLRDDLTNQQTQINLNKPASPLIHTEQKINNINTFNPIPSLAKKQSNISQKNNTNIKINQQNPTYYPIQSNISYKSNNVRPVITFNTNIKTSNTNNNFIDKIENQSITGKNNTNINVNANTNTNTNLNINTITTNINANTKQTTPILNSRKNSNVDNNVPNIPNIDKNTNNINQPNNNINKVDIPNNNIINKPNIQDTNIKNSNNISNNNINSNKNLFKIDNYQINSTQPIYNTNTYQNYKPVITNNPTYTNYHKPVITFQHNNINTQQMINKSDNPLFPITYRPHATPNTYPISSTTPSNKNNNNIQFNNNKQDNLYSKNNNQYNNHLNYQINTNNLANNTNNTNIGSNTYINNNTTIDKQKDSLNKSKQIPIYYGNKQLQQRVNKVLNRGLLAEQLSSSSNNINTSNNAYNPVNINPNATTINTYANVTNNITNQINNRNNRLNPKITTSQINISMCNIQSNPIQNDNINKNSSNYINNYTYTSNSNKNEVQISQNNDNYHKNVVSNTNNNNLISFMNHYNPSNPYNLYNPYNPYNSNSNNTNNTNTLYNYTQNNTNKSDKNILNIENNTVSLYNSNISYSEIQGSIEQI